MKTSLLLLTVALFIYPPAFGTGVDGCMEEAVKLVGPQGRVSLLQALPRSKRYGVAIVLDLKDGSKVLAIGGGVTIGHVDLIEVAQRKYGNQITGTQMWGEVKVENNTVELGVGEITEATPTSGTWWKSYKPQPEHKNTAKGLVDALAAQEAIRIKQEGFRDFDAKREHLSPMLVGRHRADSIVGGTMMKMEAMTTSWTGEKVTEKDFMDSYKVYAPLMKNELIDFSLYLDGLVNDGAMTSQTRQAVQKELDQNFGDGAKPTVAKMEKLYGSLQAALKPAADISRNPEPYIEFIRLP